MFHPFLVNMKLQILSGNYRVSTSVIETGETSAVEFPRSGEEQCTISNSTWKGFYFLVALKSSFITNICWNDI